MPPRLRTDRLLEEAPVPQLVAVRDLGRDLRLAGVEAEQGRHAVDHVVQPQAAGHDVRRVELDGAVADAALGLADSGFDEGLEERPDDLARGAPVRRPQREERRARRGGEEQVGAELVWVTDADVCQKVSGGHWQT